MDENDSKSYLILLRLMKYLKKNHSHVLYVGNDKDTISHMSDIAACYTYHVETKGMISKDMKKIYKKKKHFMAENNKIENKIKIISK